MEENTTSARKKTNVRSSEGDVVSADEERHRDEREDEERADGGDGGERSRA
jgi:hypothetical protein